MSFTKDDRSHPSGKNEMTQFHEGQEVEIAPLSGMFGIWRKAKITACPKISQVYSVLFDDGTEDRFHSDYIRPDPKDDGEI